MHPEDRPGLVRMTRQRKVILEELKRSTAHPSAEEVYALVRKRLPRISLGTVYRNLEKLSELGEIAKLTFGGAINRFDPDPEEHYHIRCSLCDRVVDAPMALLEDIEEHLTRKTEFKIIGHRLEFYGLCPECAAHMISPGLKKLKESDGQTAR
jgi:Fur family ferric uptake transcriptional regulator